MNIVVLVNVESTPGRWESERSIYMTIVFNLKDKQEINETKEEGIRIVFSPKTEISRKMESQGKHSMFKDQKNQLHVLKNGRFIK